MKLKYTYIVTRTENVTEEDLKEYGEAYGDEPMTIEKYRKDQQAIHDDEGGEYLYGGAGGDETLSVDVSIINEEKTV